MLQLPRLVITAAALASDVLGFWGQDNQKSLISARIEQLPPSALTSLLTNHSKLLLAVGGDCRVWGQPSPQPLWDAEPQRRRELAQPHFPDVHPAPHSTPLHCCGSAYAEKQSYRIQSMWMLWLESLPLFFCHSNANLAVKCLFFIQLRECLQVTFKCWIFWVWVRTCCVCQNYFIQIC